ncbi:hypothetical protein GUJ93_ZPchr0003g17462 [Zizania palustris]|uniref:Uncharacterized protein n=1 Tax=Zizania palustris TaxID=103762 RepID=A0A8J5SWU5_ZIZPA|nr:hypothetical protein GUJ93_ZPchr0003g17462 [Zizania palustris]
MARSMGHRPISPARLVQKPTLPTDPTSFPPPEVRPDATAGSGCGGRTAGDGAVDERRRAADVLSVRHLPRARRIRPCPPGPPAKLELHTLNSSRSAYASISLERDFFDEFRISSAASASGPSSTPLQCSILLKSVLSVLRTPTTALDRIAASLPHPDAPKLQLTLHCLNGVRKTYWIACSAEPEVQTLALDRSNFSSRLAIRPRDLARLLSNFQSSLQELTIIATDPTAGHSNVGGGVDEVEGKAVELRSYIDPAKDDCDTRLHTQLWIDPAEEFVEYVHSGDPVDVTFGVKELKVTDQSFVPPDLYSIHIGHKLKIIKNRSLKWDIIMVCSIQLIESKNLLKSMTEELMKNRCIHMFSCTIQSTQVYRTYKLQVNSCFQLNTYRLL